MSNLNLVNFPERDITDIPATLRRLADEIERGELGNVTHLVWVADSGAEKIEVDLGLIGKAGESLALAHLLLACAMRKLES